MNSMRLNHAEVEWILDHPRAVRKALMIALATEPEPPPLDPLAVAAMKFGEGLEHRLLHATMELEGIAQPAPDGRQTDTSQGRRDHLVEMCERLRAGLEMLVADPRSMFLPLGTVVRFAEPAPSTPVQDPSIRPVAGTIGVVTGLSHNGYRPIRVSVAREFQNSRHVVPKTFGEEPPTYNVGPEEIEIVGPGSMPDDSPCMHYGFKPTHHGHRAPGSSEPVLDEMIIEADGLFWRMSEIAGTTAVETMGAYESLADIPGLGDPLPRYSRPADENALAP